MISKPSVRIAIVANSFAGALMKALQQKLVDTTGLKFSFLVSGDLGRIEINDDRFVGWMDGPNVLPVYQVSQYDCMFIYGKMPTPYDVCRSYKALSAKGFSRQLMRQAIHDYLAASDTFELLSRFRLSTDAPIFLLSGNVPSNTTFVGRARYEKGLILIKNVLGDTYHQFPDDIFTRDGSPRIDLYKDSVNKFGDPAAPDYGKKQDIYHMNERGGALILKSIVERARRGAA